MATSHHMLRVSWLSFSITAVLALVLLGDEICIASGRGDSHHADDHDADDHDADDHDDDDHDDDASSGGDASGSIDCNRKPKSRRKNVAFKDLDDAILGLTNCKGKRNFPKSRSMFLVTYRLFKDQKLAVSGTSSCQGSCKHRNTRSARTLCPHSMKDQTKLRTWRSDVKNGIAPTMHTNAWKCFKDEQYCNVVLGRKTGTSPTRIRLCTDCTWCTDRKAKAFKGWGYGKVDGRWYEIYSKYQCGIRSKITSCEIIGKTPRCQVRKQCGSFSKVSFYSVWAIPKYPSSAGAYRKYRIAPKWFVDKALSSTHGKMGSSFQKKCRQRCAWY